MTQRLLGAILMVLMLTASVAAIALKPTEHVADHASGFDLAALVPLRFGEWIEEPSAQILAADPQQTAMLDKIYSQLLTRTYRHSNGYRIMLSIAYGSDQRDVMQVHKPEVCYPAQGFVLKDLVRGRLLAGQAELPVVRVVAAQGGRNEPITYWTTVGDQVVKNLIDKKLLEMSYGLTGRIPDGMLVRLSSIDDDNARAFSVHQQFARDLLQAVPAEGQKRLFGAMTQGKIQ